MVSDQEMRNFTEELEKWITVLNMTALKSAEGNVSQIVKMVIFKKTGEDWAEKQKETIGKDSYKRSEKLALSYLKTFTDTRTSEDPEELKNKLFER